MPGTPVLYYGDEIGMGDNVFLGDRDGVRTPMQWSFDRNGGFSRADPAMLYLPPIMDPVYGFEAVNVEAQSRSPSSLLNWTKRLIAARRTRRAFGRGTLRFLYPDNRKVIAYLREWDERDDPVRRQPARTAQAVELDLSEFRGRRVGRAAGPQRCSRRSARLPYLLTLQGHSFFWFELAATSRERSRRGRAAPEFVTLVMPHGWGDLFTRHNLPQLERDVIPAFLPRQRWFGAKDQRIRGARVLANGEMPAAPGESGDSAGRLSVQAVEAPLSGGERQHYALPLAACWAPSGSEPRNALLPATLAELRQSRREGALVDAASQDGFRAGAARRAWSGRRDIAMRDPDGRGGIASFRQTPLFAQAPAPERLVVRRLGAEQSNTSVLFERIRRPRRSIGGCSRGCTRRSRWAGFLVERAGFANTPPLLGTIEMSLPARRSRRRHSTIALGVLFGFVRNQGDGWTMALELSDSRYLDDALNEAAPGAAPPDQALELPDPDHFFLGLARQLGLRTGEMHRALAECGDDDPAFAPEPITADDIAAWRRELQEAGRGDARPARREPRSAARAGARTRRSGNRRARSAGGGDPDAGAQ